MTSLSELNTQLSCKIGEIKDIKNKIHKFKKEILKDTVFVYLTCFDTNDLVNTQNTSISSLSIRNIFKKCNKKFDSNKNVSNISVESDGLINSIKICNIPRFRISKNKMSTCANVTSTYLGYFKKTFTDETGMYIEFIDSDFSIRLDPKYFNGNDNILDIILFDCFRLIGFNNSD